MLDGINIHWIIPNFEDWRKSVPLELAVAVETFDSGHILTKKRGERVITKYLTRWETYNIEIKQITERGTNIYYLRLQGSLHKNHFGGTNYLPFTWNDLQHQVRYLCATLHINPIEAKIKGIEIGVNICTPFPVHDFIMQNIIDYQREPFVRYRKDKNRRCIGKVCDISQYSVKIYDKGLQYNLNENLMRYELKFTRMEPLKRYCINTLADLTNFDKVKKLEGLLISAWKRVLIYDIPQPINKLPVKQYLKDLLRDGQTCEFWERLKKETNEDQYKYQRLIFKQLVLNYGSNFHQIVFTLITKEWKTLAKNYPNLPSGKKELLPEFTIRIKGKNGEKLFTTQKRYCLTCQMELHPDHKESEDTCRPKIVGIKAAHDCRNKKNNPRHNFKKKIEAITRKGLLFDVLPYFNTGYQQLINQL